MTEILTRDITCRGGLPAFVAMPASPKDQKLPVMILLHERYGLVQHTKDLALRHAREGFLCLAADYFFKHPNQEALHRGDAGYDMTDPEAREYLEAAIDAALSFPSSDASRIAVMGVCQTGRHPLVIAAERPIAAALVWYGAAQDREWQVNERYPTSLDTIISKVQCPVLAMFGETDHIISIEHVRRLRSSLEAHGKSFEIQVHHGAPHGWLNDTMPGRYRREQAEAAWATQRAFLTRVLGRQIDGSTITQLYSATIAKDYDFAKNVRYE
jgi:carboxymethylenebutenolidase